MQDSLYPPKGRQKTSPNLNEQGYAELLHSHKEIHSLIKCIIESTHPGVWGRILPVNGNMYGIDVMTGQEWELLQPSLLKASLVKAIKHGSTKTLSPYMVMARGNGVMLAAVKQ